MSDNKWRRLTHNGPLFQPPYKPLPSKAKLMCNGKPVTITARAEEAAVFFAKLLIAKHKSTKDKTFTANFFEDFRDLLHYNQRKEITRFSSLNFSQIVKHLKEQADKPKPNRKIQANKLEKEREKYGFCRIDGKKEPIGNYKVEPAGLFIGRGDHPGRGRIKNRIRPQDVTINCTAGFRPKLSAKWKEVIHDQSVTWLAKYTNSLGETKYIQVSQASSLKTSDDEDKYDLAKNLGKHITRIRNIYKRGLNSRESYDQQLAVAIFFIDEFALRVGNEKGAEEADTVGCCTLRKEHVTLKSPNKVAFDFKGKDSIRFKNEFKVQPNVFNALKRITNGKTKKDKLFDLLNAQDVNSYLKELQPGLTAKVFRTYKASSLFQKELEKLKASKAHDEIELCRIFNKANLEVAKICNHKKAVNNLKAREAEKRLQKMIQAHKVKLRKIERSEGKHSARYEREEVSLRRNEIKYELKVEGREFSLNTSKQNYIDPRITIAWCEKHKLPVEKVWSKTLQKKYTWAKKTSKRFKF